MRSLKMMGMAIFLINMFISFSLAQEGAERSQLPSDEVAKAIAKVKAMGENVKPLSAEKVAWLKEEIGRFFAQQILRQATSDGLNHVQATIMVGLNVETSFNSEGKPQGKFISCENKSVVKMTDGTVYLYYENEWWKVPLENHGINMTP